MNVSYFSSSATSAFTKTIGYALAMPTAFRKFLTKDSEYRSHVDRLESIAKNNNELECVGNSILFGDLTGFVAGAAVCAGLGYAAATEYSAIGAAFAFTNIVSAGYEIAKLARR